MADDQQNPFTMMGMMQMMQPNKYISPQYKDKPLPIPGYLGTPTDAQGNPIQSFTDAQAQHDAWDRANPATPAAPSQGTTLTSSPGPGYFQTAAGSQALGSRIAPPGSLPGTQALYGRNFAAFVPPAGSPLSPGSIYGGGAAGAAGQGGAAGPKPQNPIDMRQAYLTALANPGKVTTPGATVQPSAPLGQPNVLDAFLANHQAGPAAPAGGGYSNAPFFATLSKLRSNA